MPVYRVMYTKKGPARYMSHLDLLRTFGRAARRAGLPLALTQGFNPRPKISFAAPLGVGIEGDSEFADLELSEDVSVDKVAEMMWGQFPEGISLVEVRRLSSGSTTGLMAAVERAAYRAEAVLEKTMTGAEADGLVEGFMASPEILVERKNKAGGKKLYNIRPGIIGMSGKVMDGIIIIEMELQSGSKGNVRVEEVLDSFLAHSRLAIRGLFMVCRTGLYKTDGNGCVTLW